MRGRSSLNITRSTGNVFRDLGFSAEEAEHLLVRADLLIHLQKSIASRELTEARAAKLLHVTQPRVRDLLRGRIDLFSADSLIDMLARLGVRVRVVPTPARRRMYHRCELVNVPGTDHGFAVGDDEDLSSPETKEKHREVFGIISRFIARTSRP